MHKEVNTNHTRHGPTKNLSLDLRNASGPSLKPVNFLSRFGIANFHLIAASIKMQRYHAQEAMFVQTKLLLARIEKNKLQISFP